jgi:hypothetical protein
MSSISIGAIGAAIIAGLVSLFGLIIGKEQKVSEFRQAWIDDLRKCFVDYLVHINAVSDALRVKANGEQIDTAALLQSYQSLNAANHGISLRINAEEKPAQLLMKSMSDFENLSNKNANLTPEKIGDLEKEFLKASKELLKFEWNRVKRGESMFVWTKRITVGSVIVMIAFLVYVSTAGQASEKNKGKIDSDGSTKPAHIEMI